MKLLPVWALAFFAFTTGMILANQDERKIQGLKKRETRYYQSSGEGEDVLVRTLTEEFNKQGDPVKLTLLDGAAIRETNFQNRYDGKSRLIEVRETDAATALQKKSIIEYAADGSKKVTEENYSGEKGKEKVYLLETSEYDSKGKMTAETHKEVVGGREGKRTYKYDARGHLEAMIQVFTGETTRYRYKTDDQGRMTEKVAQSEEGKPLSKDTYRWNDQGDCLEHCSYDSSSKLKQRRTFEYEYKNGNMTQMKAALYFGGSDNPVLSGKAEFDYEFYEKK